jgi:hypothetical protein
MSGIATILVSTTPPEAIAKCYEKGHVSPQAYNFQSYLLNYSGRIAICRAIEIGRYTLLLSDVNSELLKLYQFFKIELHMHHMHPPCRGKRMFTPTGTC